MVPITELPYCNEAGENCIWLDESEIEVPIGTKEIMVF